MGSSEEYEAKLAELIKNTLENQGLAEWDLMDTVFEETSH